MSDEPSAIVARFDELVQQAKDEMQYEFALASHELLFGIPIGPVVMRTEMGGLAELVASGAPDDANAAQVDPKPAPRSTINNDPLDSERQPRLETVASDPRWHYSLHPRFHRWPINGRTR